MEGINLKKGKCQIPLLEEGLVGGGGMVLDGQLQRSNIILTRFEKKMQKLSFLYKPISFA